MRNGWEYKMLYIPANSIEGLDEAGEEGWELIYKDGWYGVLKRPIRIDENGEVYS